MCYSALVLAMIFSMGEPLPYHHYGKSSTCSWLGRVAELMLGRLGHISRHGGRSFSGGQS